MSSTAVRIEADDEGNVAALNPRRRLSARQVATVERLVDAAADELSEHGHHELTVRAVARRAGVAPATAYTYFASKEHLVAEVYLRRLERQKPRRPDRRRSPTNRATDALLDIALVVADETELAAACTVALLTDDAEVAELRNRIGRIMRRRLVEALGDDVDPAVFRTLELVANGALLRVGIGHLAYDELPEVLADAARLVLGGGRS